MSRVPEGECPVVIDDEVRLGTFANAFRVVGAPDEGCFLDFLVYSAFEKQATVQTRVLIRRDFLDPIYEALNQAICLASAHADSGLRFRN